jgi:hypothetical protein
MLSVIRCIGPVVCFLSFQEERIRTGCSRGSQLRRPFVGTSWHRHKRVISNWHGRRDRQGFVEREHRGSRNSCSERSSLRGRVRTRRVGQGKCGPSKRTLLVFGFGERWCHWRLYTKQRPQTSLARNCEKELPRRPLKWPPPKADNPRKRKCEDQYETKISLQTDLALPLHRKSDLGARREGYILEGHRSTSYPEANLRSRTRGRDAVLPDCAICEHWRHCHCQ